MRMPDAERLGFWARYNQRISELRESTPCSKQSLRAAVNGLDDFVEANLSAMQAAEANGTLRQWAIDNRAAINQAIPQPARALLTQDQKEFLVKAVFRRNADDGA